MEWTQEAHQLAKNYRSRWKFKLGMLWQLPSVFFWGVRVVELSPEACAISIPFSWRTQNPFRSTYFAALAGAGELSTGLLGQLAIAGRGRWSMLVTDIRVSYTKKANSTVIFRCDQGGQLLDLIQEIERSGQPQSITMTSVGKRADGLEAVHVHITWSFLKKG